MNMFFNLTESNIVIENLIKNYVGENHVIWEYTRVKYIMNIFDT